MPSLDQKAGTGRRNAPITTLVFEPELNDNTTKTGPPAGRPNKMATGTDRPKYNGAARKTKLGSSSRYCEPRASGRSAPEALLG